MGKATLEQIDARITEIDGMLFDGSTGQISMTTETRLELESEAESLMQSLARSLEANGQGDHQALYGERQRIRSFNLLAATTRLYAELLGSQTIVSARISAACNGLEDGTVTPAEMCQILAETFGGLPIELRRATQDEPASNSWWKRLLGR